jgi:nucleotide-binding universal stress UspA family protein
MPVHAQLALLKRNPSKRLNVGVAIDGSALSDKALQTACGLIQHERSDRLIILHVADSTKT